jgi:CheY-like chemotaxis protein
VQDTGIGIAPDAQRRLFQPFSQAEESTTRKYGGTGLGLAICRELVELMGGHIGLESAPGKGTTFRFTLPFEKQRGAQEPAPDSQAVDLANRRILVVEKTEALRLLIERQMRALKLRTNGAADAAEALQILLNPGSTPFDFALLHLPGEEAAALTCKIKTTPSLAKTPLILLAPEGSLEEVPEGIDAFLGSPLRQRETLECLASLKGSSRSTRAPKSVTEEASPKPPSLRHLKILLVEDNQINRAVALGFIKKWNDHVEIADDGEKALDAVRHTAYDVILMDRELPGINGCEAARQIRQYEAGQDRPAARIIAMTAHQGDDIRRECIAAGMDDFLSKPVNGAQLQAAIERCIAR